MFRVSPCLLFGAFVISCFFRLYDFAFSCFFATVCFCSFATVEFYRMRIFRCLAFCVFETLHFPNYHFFAMYTISESRDFVILENWSNWWFRMFTMLQLSKFPVLRFCNSVFLEFAILSCYAFEVLWRSELAAFQNYAFSIFRDVVITHLFIFSI